MNNDGEGGEGGGGAYYGILNPSLDRGVHDQTFAPVSCTFYGLN